MANAEELKVRDKKTQTVWTANEQIARHWTTSELGLTVHGMGCLVTS